ncbi:hypothetical protein RM50_01870 [Pseudarthrobacter phenanthrenivorans]|uniref:Uncharacterized protein n=1 Tax=Pseudarthrobacter phenanthrenivorans TaxID=361575 RepID=A0A0B4DKS0_PSEPS|nr:hypothetical protein RM50_01870 [Pseudarthrobacter phenanthrenivorans]
MPYSCTQAFLGLFRYCPCLFRQAVISQQAQDFLDKTIVTTKIQGNWPTNISQQRRELTGVGQWNRGYP